MINLSSLTIISKLGLNFFDFYYSKQNEKLIKIRVEKINSFSEWWKLYIDCIGGSKAFC